MQGAMSQRYLQYLPILLAILMQVMNVSGWMLDTNKSGNITVRLCNESAGKLQFVEIPLQRGHDSSGDNVDKDEHACAFSQMAGVSLLPEALLFEGLLLKATPTYRFTSNFGYSPGAASPLPPSTGPPAFL